MGETPKNSGPEGSKKPLTFGEYLGVINEGLMPGLSPENRERIRMVTQCLAMAGFSYAFWSLLTTPEQNVTFVRLAAGIPIGLWFAGVVAIGSGKINSEAVETGFVGGMTLAALGGAMKGGEFGLAYGVWATMAGAVSLVGGDRLVRNLIHPQVGPRE